MYGFPSTGADLEPNFLILFISQEAYQIFPATCYKKAINSGSHLHQWKSEESPVSRNSKTTWLVSSSCLGVTSERETFSTKTDRIGVFLRCDLLQQHPSRIELLAPIYVCWYCTIIRYYNGFENIVYTQKYFNDVLKINLGIELLLKKFTFVRKFIMYSLSIAIPDPTISFVFVQYAWDTSWAILPLLQGSLIPYSGG